MIDIKSQNDLNQPETHSTEVLLSTIEELERTKKQLNKAIEGLELIANYGVSLWDIANAKWCLKQIKELEK